MYLKVAIGLVFYAVFVYCKLPLYMYGKKRFEARYENAFMFVSQKEKEVNIFDGNHIKLIFKTFLIFI